MKKYFNILIFIMSTFTFPLNAWAFWGPKNFEECLANEMKGRDIKQRYIVEDSCREKFPTLPKVKKAVGLTKVVCSLSNGVVWDFEVDKDFIAGNRIIRKSGSTLLAKNDTSSLFVDAYKDSKPNLKPGILIELNVNSGYLKVFTPQDSDLVIYADCSE